MSPCRTLHNLTRIGHALTAFTHHLARQWVADHTILLHHQPVSFLGGRTWR